MSTRVATIKGYRRKGGAVITVERDGRPTHRYRVSLRRYRALREWVLFADHGWKTSGILRSSFDASLWPAQFRCICGELHTLGDGHVCRPVAGKGGVTEQTPA